MTSPGESFVSRAGHKLAAALDVCQLDVHGWVCVDFGSHVGGFVDCLLQRGAARVHAVDPGYGVLDYRLRRDPRVVVHERTNALDFKTPEPCQLVTIDVGWTPQRLILPAARRCLPASGGLVLTLIKPQYEAPPDQLRAGVLPPERHEDVLAACRRDLAQLAWGIRQEVPSPLPGHGGNHEYVWLLSPAAG